MGKRGAKRQTFAEREANCPHIGKRFGSLVIDRLCDFRKHGGYKSFICKCDCGDVIIANLESLQKGHRTSCNWCKWRNRYVGKTNGKLTAIDVAEPNCNGPRPRPRIVCKCECGRTTTIIAQRVKTQKSCGVCVSSWKEEEIVEWLDDNGYRYTRQFTFDECRGKKNKLPFDFGVHLSDGIRLIEYHGIQHYPKLIQNHKFYGTTNRSIVETDHLKSTFCIHYNIPLLVLSNFSVDLEHSLNWFLTLPKDLL